MTITNDVAGKVPQEIPTNMTYNHERIEAIGDQLRAKITSKFTASTFLAGFGLTILSGQVFTLWQSTMLPTLFPWAVGTVVAAVVLFVDAVLQLDTLTMPKRFWDESEVATLMMLVPFNPLPTEYIRSASFIFAVIGLAVAVAYRFLVIRGEKN